MADPVFGLTATAAKQVGKVVRDALRTLPPTGRRTRRVIKGGGGGGNRVMFQVVSFDPEEGIATCVVLMKPCGGTVPLMDEDSMIEVYDPTACYFSGEDAESLPDRRGWADYMESLTAVEPYLPCFWCVSALCCQDVL